MVYKHIIIVYKHIIKYYNFATDKKTNDFVYSNIITPEKNQNIAIFNTFPKFWRVF